MPHCEWELSTEALRFSVPKGLRQIAPDFNLGKRKRLINRVPKGRCRFSPGVQLGSLERSMAKQRNYNTYWIIVQ